MKGENFSGTEKRQFLRLDYTTPLAYKVCSKDTISKLLTGYTANVSQSGVLCKITEKVSLDDILWLSFDRSTLILCEEIEKNCLVYQNGIIGKVVRIDQLSDGSFDVGLRFITREEKNFSHIYPKVHFLTETTEYEK